MRINDRVQLIKPNATDRMLLGTECRNAIGTIIKIDKVLVKDVTTLRKYWKTIISVKYDDFNEIGNHHIKQLKLLNVEYSNLHKTTNNDSSIINETKCIIWNGSNLKEILNLIELHPYLHDLEFDELEELVKEKGLNFHHNGVWQNLNIGDGIIIKTTENGRSMNLFTSEAIVKILEEVCK